MTSRTPLLVACGLMFACSENRPAEQAAPKRDEVAVERRSDLRETQLSIAAGDCVVRWTMYESEVNAGVVGNRSDCGLPLAGQAPLIAKLLGRVTESKREFRTLAWGRLHPDGARDSTMAVRLGVAALRSAEWDPRRGVPKGGDINGWVRKTANDAEIHAELREVFRQYGLDIRLGSVEKVLVLPAGDLPFYDRLQQAGARPRDKVPFDCQAWFSIKPAAAARP